ncbi:coatomer subunit beta'-3-like [Euphorbia lathyris]|uniref:coatomer subunit beta'-3-like n=1 Tax=Euphorbia lathyris TaxID=212925 RepID=UPI003313E892
MEEVYAWKQEFIHQFQRVKSIDLHSTQPWILAALHSGAVHIWNYKSQTMVKSLKISDSPVRSAKFIERNKWVVIGSDDKCIRVYDYNIMELIKQFEAYEDYIRCVSVHPSLPYVLSSSNDTSIKIWDWEKDWNCTHTFKEHTHYVMQAAFNHIHDSTFSTASLDGTIKIWNLESPSSVATMDGHSKGVNCVDYYVNGDKLYLLSGSDDYTVKVWDCETKSCVQIMECYTNNVSAVCVHPELPIIITGSEDGTIRIWNAETYQLEKTLNCSLERVWAIGCIKESHRVVFGCDDGTMMLKISGSNLFKKEVFRK